MLLVILVIRAQLGKWALLVKQVNLVPLVEMGSLVPEAILVPGVQQENLAKTESQVQMDLQALQDS